MTPSIFLRRRSRAAETEERVPASQKNKWCFLALSNLQGKAAGFKCSCYNSIIQYKTATAGSDVVQSGRPTFDDFFQHLWPYIGNNTANVVFQMVKRLWLIRIDQLLYIAPQKIV
ncbi:hypothetical protein TNCV_5015901 [Trichonephila clavipes]|nr:hypothetical protein TNCV_5015901 [Trichonephila clavipes]